MRGTDQVGYCWSGLAVVSSFARSNGVSACLPGAVLSAVVESVHL